MREHCVRTHFINMVSSMLRFIVLFLCNINSCSFPLKSHGVRSNFGTGMCSATGNNNGCFLQGKPAETESGHTAHQFVPKASVTLFFSVCVCVYVCVCVCVVVAVFLFFYLFVYFWSEWWGGGRGGILVPSDLKVSRLLIACFVQKAGCKLKLKLMGH